MSITQMSITQWFATPIYRDALSDRPLIESLAHSVRQLAVDDHAGRRWAREHGYSGYTSYASLDDLPRRDPAFADLVKRIDRHVACFLPALAYAGVGRLKLDSLWVNLLRGGAGHASHIHPHSVLSGTVYIEHPAGAGGLRFEDPRLGLMMAAPPRAPDAEPGLQPFVTIVPEPGTILLWESWLRHEVPATRSRGERISISFNYR